MIELILVLTLLLVVISLAAPSLGRFFRGRDLDNEARRFMALTRYAQSLAAAEGIPVRVWIDPDQGRYGLEPDSGFITTNAWIRTFELHENLRVEVEALARQLSMSPRLAMASTPTSATSPHASYIRCTTDGFLGSDSPERIWFLQGEDDALCVGRGRNRLRYEILTNDAALRQP